ncbi:MAG: HPr family phosphocarrier protein [Candidatus Omnitrophica bacterium]|nr:HPr family phosphocarrier protein [Candidatus Omnitrophota bacterium]
MESQIIVNSNHGLHARPAAVFVQIANKFDSKVSLAKDGECVDGKSIIAILSLGINRGAQVSLIAEGRDAKETADELRKFLESNND